MGEVMVWSSAHDTYSYTSLCRELVYPVWLYAQPFGLVGAQEWWCLREHRQRQRFLYEDPGCTETH